MLYIELQPWKTNTIGAIFNVARKVTLVEERAHDIHAKGKEKMLQNPMPKRSSELQTLRKGKR